MVNTKHLAAERIATTLRLPGKEHNAVEEARAYISPGKRESWNQCARRLIKMGLNLAAVLATTPTEEAKT